MVPASPLTARRTPAAGGHCSAPCSAAASKETTEATTLAPPSPGQSSTESTAGVSMRPCSQLVAYSVCSDPQVVAAVWRRVQSFMSCVTASPLVRSTLVARELSRHHVPAGQVAAAGDGGLLGGTRWMLAQMLAMHLRAGYTEATEASVLAGLLVLESQYSGAGACSDARTFSAMCLEHLGTVAPEAVARLDWEQLACALHTSVAAAQLDLLERVGWKTSLNFAAEVQPCRSLLFRLPGPTLKQLQLGTLPHFPAEVAPPASTPLLPPGAGGIWQQGASMAAARATWAITLHRMCNSIRLQAVLQQQRGDAGLRADVDGCEGMEAGCEDIEDVSSPVAQSTATQRPTNDM